jgi:hypothetical protein
MKNSPNSPEGHKQKRNIPVQVIEGISRIAVRPAVGAALLISAVTPAVAEAAPKKLTEKQRLEHKMEDRIKSHLPVKFLNGILRIQTEKKPQSTGGAEAFMPLHPPESEAMADEGEVSPLDRYDESFVNRPLYRKGKDGREYVGELLYRGKEVDVKLRRFNHDNMSVMSDQTGHGEKRNVVFHTTNDINTIDLSSPMNALGGKPYLGADGQPQMIGQALELDMD